VVDWAKGEISVYNENFFITTEGYEFRWELTKNGETIGNGTFNAIVNPGEKKTIALKLALPCNQSQGVEYFLNVYALHERGCTYDSGRARGRSGAVCTRIQQLFCIQTGCFRLATQSMFRKTTGT
jgi:hypothetical protein